MFINFTDTVYPIKVWKFSWVGRFLQNLESSYIISGFHLGQLPFVLYVALDTPLIYIVNPFSVIQNVHSVTHNIPQLPMF